MNEQTQLELEAATFRRLLAHLQQRTDAQNIDLMILAGFCRNCLAKWYSEAAAKQGSELSYAAAQELVYGMPYSVWKERYQADATPENLAEMAKAQQRRHQEA